MEQTALLPWMVVLALVVYVGVPYIAVRTENSGQTTGPGTFALWFAAGYVGPPLAALYLGPLLSAPLLTGLACMAVAAVTVFIAFRHLVRRVRDAGYGRNLALLAVVPLVTIACAVFLVTAPRVPRNEP